MEAAVCRHDRRPKPFIAVHLMKATRVLRLKTSFPPASTRHEKTMKCRNFKDGGRNDENSRKKHALLCDKSGTNPSIKNTMLSPTTRPRSSLAGALSALKKQVLQNGTIACCDDFRGNRRKLEALPSGRPQNIRCAECRAGRNLMFGIRNIIIIIAIWIMTRVYFMRGN